MCKCMYFDWNILVVFPFFVWDPKFSTNFGGDILVRGYWVLLLYAQCTCWPHVPCISLIHSQFSVPTIQITKCQLQFVALHSSTWNQYYLSIIFHLTFSFLRGCLIFLFLLLLLVHKSAGGGAQAECHASQHQSNIPLKLVKSPKKITQNHLKNHPKSCQPTPEQ